MRSGKKAKRKEKGLITGTGALLCVHHYYYIVWYQVLTLKLKLVETLQK